MRKIMDEERDELFGVLESDDASVNNIVGEMSGRIGQKVRMQAREGWRCREGATCMDSRVRCVDEARRIIHEANRFAGGSRVLWNAANVALKVHLVGLVPRAVATFGRFGVAFFTDAVFEKRSHHAHLPLQLRDARVGSLSRPTPLRGHKDASLLAFGTSLTLIWRGRVGKTANLEASTRLAGAIELLLWRGLGGAWFTRGGGGL